MRVFLATVGTAPYHIGALEAFAALAAADEVGEHQLARSAEDADAVLFVDLQQHPADLFLAGLRRHPLVRAHPEKICVYDERDRPFASFPGIYVAGTPRLARRNPIAGGAYPRLLTVIPRTGEDPDLLFSFCGARTHPVRGAVLALEHPRGLVRDTTGISFFGWDDEARDQHSDAAREQYVATVQRSKFVLCPRGHGPSSFRLYETLAAGRVPVVISDDWLAPPRIDWGACSVRVPESDVARMPQLLGDLERRWPEMSRAAAATFDAHFATGRLWNHYAATLAQLLPGSPRTRPWWAQREVLHLAARGLRDAGRRRARPPAREVRSVPARSPDRRTAATGCRDAGPR
jgi:exostosin family protein